MRFVLLCVLLSLACTARAGSVEIEFGQCRFGQAKNGTFYDKAYDHHNYVTPRCAEIAWADTFRGSSWGYRVAFIQSGSVEGRDNRALMNDGLYDPNPCTDKTWANCQSLFGGSGRMRGVRLALTKEKRSGDWWVRGEAGLLFFKDFFNGYAKPENFNGARPVAIGYMGGTATRWEGAGGLEQKSEWSGNPLPEAGLSVGYRALYASARYHFPMNREGQSITDHSFLQLTVGVRIAFRP